MLRIMVSPRKNLAQKLRVQGSIFNQAEPCEQSARLKEITEKSELVRLSHLHLIFLLLLSKLWVKGIWKRGLWLSSICSWSHSFNIVIERWCWDGGGEFWGHLSIRSRVHLIPLSPSLSGLLLILHSYIKKWYRYKKKKKLRREGPSNSAVVGE